MAYEGDLPGIVLGRTQDISRQKELEQAYMKSRRVNPVSYTHLGEGPFGFCNNLFAVFLLLTGHIIICLLYTSRCV